MRARKNKQDHFPIERTSHGILTALYKQLPSEYYELLSRLNLARRTWQTVGVGLGVGLDELDDYETVMLETALGAD